MRLILSLSLLLCTLPSPSHAHGGLPVSQQILWRGDTLLVPTPFWGFFVGTNDGPWRWICEEAINPNQQRRFALGQDGTLYATDQTGLTVSRDGGCTWGPVTSGINTFQIIDVVTDPQTPRVFALASAKTSTDSGLWRSDDAGQTWQPLYRLPNHTVSGLRISEDGRTLLVTSLAPTTTRASTLHVSRDGGTNFTAQAITYQVDGQDIGVSFPLWIDPRPPGELYIATRDLPTNVVLRIDMTGTATEVMRVQTGIRDMLRDPRNDQLLVATSRGLWAGQGGATLQPLPTLSATQCLSLHGDALYACSWNYAPDNAAVARLFDDATHFTKVFQYHETQAPMDCPAGTSVATICPGIFMNYAEQLGIDLTAQRDQQPAETGGCAVGKHAASAMPWGALALLAGVLSSLLMRWANWRGRRRSSR